MEALPEETFWKTLPRAIRYPQPQVRANWTVPHGKIYRYWNTEGEAVYYVNHGWILLNLTQNVIPDPLARIIGFPLIVESRERLE